MTTLMKTTEDKDSHRGENFNMLITLRSRVVQFNTCSTESVILPFCSCCAFWKKLDSHYLFFSRKKEKILRFNNKAAVLIWYLKAGKGKMEGWLPILKD